MGKYFDTKSVPGFGFIAALTILIMYIPVVILVIFAFNESSSLSIFTGFSLKWFVVAANNEEIISATIRSLQIASLAAIISTVAATMAALGTTRTTGYKGLKTKVMFLSIPLVVPEIVTAVALLILVSRLKVWTGYTGLGYLILAHSAFCVPFAFMPIRARLEGMDTTLEAAAEDLYASRWQSLRYVTLPLMIPGILSGFVLAFVISLDDVVITEFVKSAGQNTLPTYMLGQIRRGTEPDINAVSTVFLAVSIILIVTFFLISNRKKSD